MTIASPSASAAQDFHVFLNELDSEVELNRSSQKVPHWYGGCSELKAIMTQETQKKLATSPLPA